MGVGAWAWAHNTYYRETRVKDGTDQFTFRHFVVLVFGNDGPTGALSVISEKEDQKRRKVNWSVPSFTRVSRHDVIP